jgi:hypothetical protein
MRSYDVGQCEASKLNESLNLFDPTTKTLQLLRVQALMGETLFFVPCLFLIKILDFLEKV